MKEILAYMSGDGNIFETKEECQEYENKEEVRNAIKTIVNYCENRCSCEGCQSCVFANACEEFFRTSPANWYYFDEEY